MEKKSRGKNVLNMAMYIDKLIQGASILIKIYITNLPSQVKKSARELEVVLLQYTEA